MLKNTLKVALCAAAFDAAVAMAESTAPSNLAAKQQIARAGSQASMVGPAANFTGQVRIDMLWPTDGGLNTSGALVTFEPGARSAWHTHPVGQRLVVHSGVGLTQEWGSPFKKSARAMSFIALRGLNTGTVQRPQPQ